MASSPGKGFSPSNTILTRGPCCLLRETSCGRVCHLFSCSAPLLLLRASFQWPATSSGFSGDAPDPFACPRSHKNLLLLSEPSLSALSYIYILVSLNDIDLISRDIQWVNVPVTSGLYEVRFRPTLNFRIANNRNVQTYCQWDIR